MARYDGLIIPRSYSEYINKTDAATLLQALQLSGVMDNAPTANSNHPTKSGGVFDALAGKQPTLTFDDVPTDGSANPVKSNGIYDALATKLDKNVDSLTALTQAKATDELIVYDTTASESKKITKDNLLKSKFPDYASGNLLTTNVTTYTTTENCYCLYLLIASSSGDRNLLANGIQISVYDSSGNNYISSFSGFLRSGTVLTRADGGILTPNLLKIFKLS